MQTVIKPGRAMIDICTELENYSRLMIKEKGLLAGKQIYCFTLHGHVMVLQLNLSLWLQFVTMFIITAIIYTTLIKPYEYCPDDESASCGYQVRHEATKLVLKFNAVML